MISISFQWTQCAYRKRQSFRIAEIIKLSKGKQKSLKIYFTPFCFL